MVMQIWPWWKNDPNAARLTACVDVGVVEHDEGGVAAELEVGPLEVPAGELADPAPGGRSSR